MILAASQAGNFAYLIGVIIGILFCAVIFLGIPTLFIVSLVISITRRTKGWIILCIIFGLLLLVPVGLFSFGVYRRFTQYKEYVAQEQVIPEGGEITSEDGLFKLKVPELWKILKNLNDVAVIQVGNPQKEQYLIVIVDMKDDFDGSLTEHASITSQNIVSATNNYQISEPEHLDINGNHGIRYYITGTIDRTKVKYIQTTIEGRKAFYQILTWTIPSKSKEAFEVFEQAVQSFREVDEQL